MPSPAGKGDREAVDEENFLSCLPLGGRGTTKWWKEPAGTKAKKKTLQRADILPYRYLSISACPDPKRSSRFSLFTLHSSLLFCLPPGGRGTAKRWKEQAGTIAKNMTLLRANMQSAPTKIRPTIRIDRNARSSGSNQLPVGEGLAPPEYPLRLSPCGAERSSPIDTFGRKFSSFLWPFRF